MKRVKIKYNPYLIQTEIQVNGKSPKDNSRLNFKEKEKRLQEWCGQLADILIEEYNDRNFNIEFTGTLADYEDLKTALYANKTKIQITELSHICTPSVAEVEAKVDEIFTEIINGPVEELRDQSIIEAFKDAKNQTFEINVVATMSSGKSTLINALLGYNLLPARAEATTATIVRITATNQETYSAIAYDSSGEVYARVDDLSLNKMNDLNDNPEISLIDITGPIPCVNEVGMKLVLVDTPGPNNVRDRRHREKTYQMVRDSPKSLVLFVLNAAYLQVDDQDIFLDYVCDCMKDGGKQSRDRFIFAVNKLDEHRPGVDNIEKTLHDTSDYLSEKNIPNANLFPVSALAALELRTEDEYPMALDRFRKLCMTSPEHRFDGYLQYNHLPDAVRIGIEEELKQGNDDAIVEIHTGIVSIEEAIKLYVSKYARTTKIMDLVMAFNDRLDELETIAKLKKSIQEDKSTKEKIDAAIKEIRSRIKDAEQAKSVASIIEEINVSKDVDKRVNQILSVLQNKINNLILKYEQSTKIKKSEALVQLKSLQKESEDIQARLEVELEKALNDTFIGIFNTSVSLYRKHVESLGIGFDLKSLGINPMTFIATNITDITKLITNSTRKEDEGKYETQYKQESYQEKKTNWFWEPWNWYTSRYETKYRTVPVQEWVANYVEYVNANEVVRGFFQPVQLQLKDASKMAREHVESETVRIKDELIRQLKKIEALLAQKLEELSISLQSANETEAQMKRKSDNLAWMQSIQTRVNDLIKF